MNRLLSSRPVASLIALSLLYRLFFTSLLQLTTAYLPLFDTSPDTLLPRSSLLHAFVRWDVLWFVRVAMQGGYRHEQETAFGWGWIEVLRSMGEGVELFGGKGWTEVERLVLGGVIASWVAGIGATVAFYHLTLRLSSSPSLALLSSLLYILSPSPGALLSASTEPLFAFLTLSGQLLLAQPLTHKPSSSLYAKFASLGRYVGSTVLLALGTSVRPLGALNAGFVWWNLIGGPAMEGSLKPSRVPSRAFACIISTLAIIYPFFRAQRAFYIEHCVQSLTPAGWCSNKLPLLYTHVQAKYWNVGFLNYWRPAQIPNFLISLPIYAVLTYAHYTALRPLIFPPPAGPPPFSRNQNQALPNLLLKPKPSSSDASTYPSNVASQDSLSAPSLTPNPTNPSLSGKVNTSAILTPQHILLSPHPSFLPLPQCVPFILISLLTTTILLLNSHVQIALRLAQTLPVFYWGAAQLILAKPSAGSEVEMETKEGEGEGKGQMSGWGKIYVRWVVSWSLVATVLWGGFYPPA